MESALVFQPHQTSPAAGPAQQTCSQAPPCLFSSALSEMPVFFNYPDSTFAFPSWFLGLRPEVPGFCGFSAPPPPFWVWRPFSWLVPVILVNSTDTLVVRSTLYKGTRERRCYGSDCGNRGGGLTSDISLRVHQARLLLWALVILSFEFNFCRDQKFREQWRSAFFISSF